MTGPCRGCLTPVPVPHRCHPTGATPAVSSHRCHPQAFPMSWYWGPLGDQRSHHPFSDTQLVSPRFCLPHGPRRSRTCTSSLQPSPELAGQLGGGTVTVTVTVTHSTPSWPGLLHGDIVPARMSPDGCGGRPGAAAPGTDSGSSAGRRARQCTGHPQGTSDSMGTHDQVLGFLTQRGWWQQVAWPDCRTLLSVWLWPRPRQGCDMWHKVSCGLCHTMAWHIPGSARPCGGTTA